MESSKLRRSMSLNPNSHRASILRKTSSTGMAAASTAPIHNGDQRRQKLRSSSSKSVIKHKVKGLVSKLKGLFSRKKHRRGGRGGEASNASVEVEEEEELEKDEEGSESDTCSHFEDTDRDEQEEEEDSPKCSGFEESQETGEGQEEENNPSSDYQTRPRCSGFVEEENNLFDYQTRSRCNGFVEEEEEQEEVVYYPNGYDPTGDRGFGYFPGNSYTQQQMQVEHQRYMALMAMMIQQQQQQQAIMYDQPPQPAMSYMPQYGYQAISIPSAEPYSSTNISTEENPNGCSIM